MMDEILSGRDLPPREALCISCRTALCAGEPCDLAPEHVVAHLEDPDGREDLITAVWGTQAERLVRHRRAAQIQRSLAATSIVGVGAGIFLTSMFVPAFSVLHIVSGLATGGLMWSGGRRVIAPDDRTFPRGAEASAVEARALSMGPRGVVVGGADLVAPATSTECVAYAVELQLDGYFGHRVMYRDAVTIGFDVVLDDGMSARVSPGRLRLVGPMRQEIDVDNPRIEEYIQAFDPQRMPHHPFDPLRYNVVCEQTLVPGARVELASRFEPVVDPRADATHYRDAAPSRLAPRGIPIIRLLAP